MYLLRKAVAIGSGIAGFYLVLGGQPIMACCVLGSSAIILGERK